MIIFKTIKDIQEYITNIRATGSAPGFIPTMGALHSGHISLIEKAKTDGMMTICSIFLNPTQFNNKNDFEKYPVSTENDIELLLRAGCDLLFLPSVSEIYPDGQEMASYDFGYLDTILEGAHRPGHFKGVGQVVARLLDIIKPDKLYLGQKDYQQCMVIKVLASKLALDNLDVKICPTVREEDGLAMSSRNRRLTDGQRVLAVSIYQCLVSIQSKRGAGKFEIVKKECEDLLKQKGFEPEYVALANADNLNVLTDYNGTEPMVALIAASIGGIRLIDNMVL